MEIVGLIIVVIVALFSVSGAGLNKKLNKIHSKLCLIVILLAIAFSIYTVGYSGEQGGIGLILVGPGIGISCLVITIILWVIQFFTKNNSSNDQ
ncbi:hypothetical protein [uncultured Cocleimonas sp.]|uniref:hypothetical protein n=1 Tax=uncultured Cocleimonas sp. TaxID=1051587 RepID=UPI0026289949|nr:hypothetical protein [uncultured Cocleimonas sp.]